MRLPSSCCFLSWRTYIMPSTYFYTSFVSDLVLAKSVAVGKTSRQTLLFKCLLYWLHIVWAHCRHYKTHSPHYSPHYILTESTISGLWHSIAPRPSPKLKDKIWELPGNEATFPLTSKYVQNPWRHICWKACWSEFSIFIYGNVAYVQTATAVTLLFVNFALCEWHSVVNSLSPSFYFTLLTFLAPWCQASVVLLYSV